MLKKLLLPLLCLGFLSANAGYVPVALTGFNADVVANGIGTAASSVTADVDGAGWAFVAQNFQLTSTSAAPSAYLINSGSYISNTTPGLPYQLASYSGPNCLRLNAATPSDTVFFATPISAGEVFLLWTGGSGSVNADVTIVYTDNTTEPVSAGNTVPDWFGATAGAVNLIGRVNTGSNGLEAPATGPRLYEKKIVISSANQTKQIAFIVVTRNSGGVLNLMAVSINQPCIGLPAAGVTVANMMRACASDNISLSLDGASSGYGMVYVWERSVDYGANWAVITGATTATASVTQTVNTLYRAKLSCNGGPVVTSVPISVGMRPCYCSPFFTSGCSTWRLLNVTFSTINNSPTACATSNYTHMIGTATAGVPFPMSITSNQYCGHAVYIDLNHDGDFNDTDEWLFTDAYNGGATVTINPNITIPAGTEAGQYRLRVVAKWGGGPVAGQACTSFPATSYGNWHDYTLNVLSNTLCVPPANVWVTNVDSTTATANWFSGTGTVPNGYRWIIVPQGAPSTATPIASGTAVAPTSSAPITGLSANTAYSLYVRSGCGPSINDSSAFEGPADFLTNLAPCNAPATQASSLVLAPVTTSILVSYTAASPAADKYLVVRTLGTTPWLTQPVDGTNYTVGSTVSNGTVVYVGANLSFTDGGLVSNTTYTYNVYALNDLCIGGPKYNTTSPLIGTTTTTGANTYAWTGATSTNWTVATNWNPVRNVPDATDILLFNSGATHTVTNIPTQTVRRIVFSNNTTASFQAAATATLTIASDNSPATDELEVPQGSSLITNGTTAALTIVFGGAGSTATIAGTLESVSTSFANTVNFTNSVTTVESTGTLTGGGTSGTNVLLGSVSSLLMNGTYNCKYTTGSGPAVPTATWNTGSTVLISGYTTATGGPNGGLNQIFHNFTYNCPNQTSTSGWSGNGPIIANGTFSVISTGTGTWNISSTQGYQYIFNNYVQTGGTLNMNSGATTAPPTFNIYGNFNQTGGTLTSTGASTGANTPVIHFNGTAGVQNVNFNNAAPVGRITYRISNPAGINLTGTGTLTGNFNLNDFGGIRISTTAANPITTSLTLNYLAGSNLTYDQPGNATATATVWPATAGPVNVFINTGGSSNVVTVPFNRTIAGSLNMTSGDIDISANTLTLGTAPATAGTLNYTAGNIRLTTGSFVRWYNTTGLPTSAGTGVGHYPVAFGGVSRSVSLYFNSATALSAGGTIGVNHTNVPGMTTGLTVVDAGPYTIETRTNANWNFVSANGIAASGTIGVRLTGTGLFNPVNSANLRVLRANTVVGNHTAGTGVSALRTGLTLADLTTAPLYIGAAAVDIGGVWVAINTGNWGTGSTWDVGTPPSNVNDAYINSGVTVTADALSNTSKSLTIYAGGTLAVNSNTVTIAENLTNNGTVDVGGGVLAVNNTTATAGSIANNGGAIFNVFGGAVNLGPAGGGNKPFNNNGILNVSGTGTLNINGAFTAAAGSTLNQTGGNINVDGNAAGNIANSVASGTKIVNILTPNINLTGGVFTMVDPHTSTAGTNAFEYNVATTHVNPSGTHLFRVGDGVSTDAGGNANYGFSINTAITTGRFNFNNLEVNAGSATNSYLVQGATIMGVLGNLVVNNGGEFRQPNNQTVHIAGDLTVNTGGIFSNTTTSVVSFARYFNAVVTAVTVPQTVSGGGTFRNVVTGTPTGKFRSITINNAAGGVNFNIGDIPYSGTLTFTLGKAIMGANTMIQLGGAGVTGPGQATGWIYGKFQKNAGTGGINHDYFVGDANYYTPVKIEGPAGSVLTSGDIVVSSVTNDHPSIGTSTIAASASVNRYYTVQAVNGITFNANSISMTYNWNAADLDPLAVPANFIVGDYSGSAWTYPTVSNPTATNIKAAIPGTNIDGQYQVGQACTVTAITSQPASQTICIGNTATFGVTATGTGLTYQWKKNGTDIPGATASTYVINGVMAGDAGNYTVVVSNACGTAALTSGVAVLSINTPASIGTQPVSQSICENSPVTFSVGATGTGLTYQWQKNGTNIAGATSASYTINSVQAGDAGNYSVIVFGAFPCGSVTSSAATLTIKPLPLTITPASSTVFCAGGSVVINASTAAGLTYQWLLNGNIIGGATASSYTANASGDYSVKISSTNGCVDTSAAMTVTANSNPTAIITPANTGAFCAGSSITLNANTGIGLTYQWKLNGTDIGGATAAAHNTTTAGSYTVVVSSSANCSATSSATVVSINPLPTATITPGGPTTFCQGGTVSLNANTGTGLTYQWRLNGSTITAATGSSYVANSPGSYKVVVTNGNGCQDSSTAVTVVVNALPAATNTPAGATTICNGNTVTLNANTGTGFSWQWKQNGTDIPGATASSYGATATGSYTVVVTNGNGCQNTSNAVAVTVNPLPNVTVTASGPLTFCQGGNVTLTAPSTVGQTYQWRLNGNPIAGANANTYTANASGSYTVQVIISVTGCSAISTASVVVVNALPTATITPNGPTTFCQGNSVTLSGNSGTGFTYQWRLNGTDITGATNQAYIANASGSYTVRITNGNGCQQTSAATVVVVNPLPQSNVSYTQPISFCDGGAVVLSGPLTPGLSYQWKRDGLNIPGETSSSLIVSASGVYTVSVTNTATNCNSVSATGVTVTVFPIPQPVIVLNNGILSTGIFTTYQWFRNNIAIPGATSSTYQPTQNGSYHVIVTDANSCSNLSNVILMGSVSVGNVNAKAVKVYPNPVKTVLMVEAPMSVNAELKDIAGRTILKIEDARQIDLSHVADGAYMLLISDRDGRLIKKEKVIKSE